MGTSIPRLKRVRRCPERLPSWTSASTSALPMDSSTDSMIEQRKEPTSASATAMANVSMQVSATRDG